MREDARQGSSSTSILTWDQDRFRPVRSDLTAGFWIRSFSAGRGPAGNHRPRSGSIGRIFTGHIDLLGQPRSARLNSSAISAVTPAEGCYRLLVRVEPGPEVRPRTAIVPASPWSRLSPVRQRSFGRSSSHISNRGHRGGSQPTKGCTAPRQSLAKLIGPRDPRPAEVHRNVHLWRTKCRQILLVPGRRSNFPAARPIRQRTRSR